MSDSDVELRRLVNALPQYEEQIRYWESQLDAISNVKTDIFQAEDTINGMIKSEKSNEMLVPVGHNTSIFATENDMERVLVGLGSRVYMETTREDSLNRLNKRLNRPVPHQSQLLKLLHGILQRLLLRSFFQKNFHARIAPTFYK